MTVSDVGIAGEIIKRDDEARIVYGWAMVVEKNGKAVVDHQGDIIPQAEMEKAAIAFMQNHRVGGILHIRKADNSALKVAEVVASFPMTTEIQKAFGLDMGKAGWMIGVKVLDDGIWKMVKEGKLPAFSIGGKGVRVPAE